MNILLINGSPRKNSNTQLALKEMQKIFLENNIESEIIDIGKENIRGCIACGVCSKNNKCAFEDIVNKVALKFEKADGIVIGTPVYYACPNATVLSFLQRLFYSSHFDKTMKVGASIVCARRGGCSSAFDVENKYFEISGMPVVSSQYWNSIHGGAPQEAINDEEGMQTIRVLARNMAFLVKSIQLGKETFGLPKKEKHVWTNFI